jgi:hypothetical protein
MQARGHVVRRLTRAAQISSQARDRDPQQASQLLGLKDSRHRRPFVFRDRGRFQCLDDHAKQRCHFGLRRHLDVVKAQRGLSRNPDIPNVTHKSNDVARGREGLR